MVDDIRGYSEVKEKLLEITDSFKQYKGVLGTCLRRPSFSLDQWQTGRF